MALIGREVAMKIARHMKSRVRTSILAQQQTSGCNKVTGELRFPYGIAAQKLDDEVRSR